MIFQKLFTLKSHFQQFSVIDVSCSFSSKTTTSTNELLERMTCKNFQITSFLEPLRTCFYSRHVEWRGKISIFNFYNFRF